MAKKETKPALGIEPSEMSVPKMDRPSVALSWFLDSIRFVAPDEFSDLTTMECALCSSSICEVEHGDTLRVLLNTALAHNCE